MNWFVKLFSLEKTSIKEIRQAVERNVEATEALTELLREDEQKMRLAAKLNGQKHRIDKRE